MRVWKSFRPTSNGKAPALKCIILFITVYLYWETQQARHDVRRLASRRSRSQLPSGILVEATRGPWPPAVLPSIYFASTSNKQNISNRKGQETESICGKSASSEEHEEHATRTPRIRNPFCQRIARRSPPRSWLRLNDLFRSCRIFRRNNFHLLYRATCSRADPVSRSFDLALRIVWLLRPFYMPNKPKSLELICSLIDFNANGLYTKRTVFGCHIKNQLL